MKKLILLSFSAFIISFVNPVSASLPDDAGVSSIDSLTARCPGNQDIFATIQNYGNNVLATVTLNWSVNTISQSPLMLNINLNPGDSLQVMLGAVTFLSSTPLDISAWTSMPNGNADSDPSNDLANANGILPALTGNFTVGGSLPDYSSLGGAFLDLESRGVCGPVSFEIRPGTYAQQLTLHEVPGTSIINTVTFYAENNDSMAVDISFPSSTTATDNFTLQILDADHIIFHHLTFSRTGTGNYSTIVDLSGESDDIRFYNNRFLGVTSATTINTDGSRSCIFSPVGASGDDRLIENNLFLGNANGLWMNGDMLNNSSGMIVRYNQFENFYVGAFLLYQNAPDVSENIITRNNTTSTVDYYAISLRFCSGPLVVSKNKITAYTGSWGIRLRDCVSTMGNQGLVVNNFVQIGTAGTGRGISVEDNSTYQYIYHNSVHYNGSSAANGRAFFLSSAGTNNIRLLNNIFANSGGGYAYYVDDNAQPGLALSDNNCLYSTGILAYWSGTQANLALLQSASGKETNSISTNPLFTSANDLHVSAGMLADAGSSLAGIFDDIDGQLRDVSSPDIGADEFTFTGILNPQARSSVFSVYPNPSAGMIRIQNSGRIAELLNVRLFDIKGVQVKSLVAVPDFTSMDLDLSGLADGVYLLQIDNSMVSEKFPLLIQH